MNAKKLIVEAIGTFFLVFTVGTAVASGSPLAPLAIGGVLMVMIFAGGHISGAHFNPAVTVAVLVRGRIAAGEAVGYIAAQIAGAVLAALATIAVLGERFGDAFSPADALPAGIAELLFTFALAWVVINVATAGGTAGNSFYGLAIGFTVVAGAIAVGGVSGGVFNPAVLVGGLVTNLFDVSTLWYVVVQLVAGALAGAIFRAVAPAEDLAPAS